MTVTNGYCTPEDVANELNMQTIPNAAYLRIEAAVNAASRQIDGHTGRRFWQDTTVADRQYVADSNTECWVDDISTTDGLVIKVDDDDDGVFETTLSVGTNVVLYELNAVDRVPAWPYTKLQLVDSSGATRFPVYRSGRPGVQVTAKFGWPAVPDAVAKATVIQAVQVYKAADAAFGAVQIGADGFVHRLGATINPIAAALLEDFCKPRVA